MDQMVKEYADVEESGLIKGLHDVPRERSFPTVRVRPKKSRASVSSRACGFSDLQLPITSSPAPKRIDKEPAHSITGRHFLLMCCSESRVAA
jgi:hypothetical protein